MNSALQTSVWIPTYKRPEMLRTALRSVAAQTAVGSIREVVVTENGPDERSRAVCAEFAGLPINYSCREKSLPPGSRENVEAGKQVLRSLKTRLAALLFDDDWWAPDHLAKSLESHAVVSGCVATCCPCVQTTGESGYLVGLLDDYTFWFAAHGNKIDGRWVLSLPDLIVASLIATPFHYSSLVIDRDTYLSCLESTGQENTYDTDRMLAVELGRYGKVVNDPTPSVFVRYHPGTETMRLIQSGEAKQRFINSTDRILQRAESVNLNVHAEFASRLKSTNALIDHIRSISHMQTVDYLIQRGVLDKSLRNESPYWSYAKRAAKGIMPPVLYGAVSRLRNSNTGLAASNAWQRSPSQTCDKMRTPRQPDQ